MNLPDKENCIIVHYGCSDFKKSEHEIFWIGAVYFENGKKKYFFEKTTETQLIEKFKVFIDQNVEKTFIHWSMNSPKFGFQAIQNRYRDLTKNEIELYPVNEIDLSEYLKEKYGINYINRDNGRLDNLALLNKFSGVKSNIEVINLCDATNRLELIFSIVQADLQNNLKTLTPQQKEGIEPTKGLTSIYSPVQLGKIFDCLNKEKQRIDPKRKADFISIFQADELKNWNSVKWSGSNPELATLIFILTETEPIPSIVNTYFKPDSKYDSHSHGGKKDSEGRNRNTNHAIKQIINSCLK